jgi:hypothetical protein
VLNKDYVKLYHEAVKEVIGKLDLGLVTLSSELAKPALYGATVVIRQLLVEQLPMDQIERKWEDIYQRINNPLINRDLFKEILNDSRTQ